MANNFDRKSYFTTAVSRLMWGERYTVLPRADVSTNQYILTVSKRKLICMRLRTAPVRFSQARTLVSSQLSDAGYPHSRYTLYCQPTFPPINILKDSKRTVS